MSVKEEHPKLYYSKELPSKDILDLHKIPQITSNLEKSGKKQT